MQILFGVLLLLSHSWIESFLTLDLNQRVLRKREQYHAISLHNTVWRAKTCTCTGEFEGEFGLPSVAFPAGNRRNWKLRGCIAWRTFNVQLFRYFIHYIFSFSCKFFVFREDADHAEQVEIEFSMKSMPSWWKYKNQRNLKKHQYLGHMQ